jgi:hypothetical protein
VELSKTFERVNHARADWPLKQCDIGRRGLYDLPYKYMSKRGLLRHFGGPFEKFCMDGPRSLLISVHLWNHGLLLGTLTRRFRRPMIIWMGSYLTGRTQRVRVGDYLFETIYCHSGVPQGSHLGPLFFIADIKDVLNIFENVRVLAYADDLKSPHQEVHSARIERIQHNFIRFALRGLGWTTHPLPPYESRCLLLGLEVLSNRKK